MIQAWQGKPSASIISPVLAAMAMTGSAPGWVIGADCAARALLLAGAWQVARRSVPREYLQVVTAVSAGAGLVGWWGGGLLRGAAWEPAAAFPAVHAGLGWAGLALGSRLAARRIWWVPGSLAQPGGRIIGTAALLSAAGLALPSVFSRWGHPPVNVWVGFVFIVSQLVLQVAITPWLLDKRSIPPAAHNRALWWYGSYIVVALALGWFGWVI